MFPLQVIVTFLTVFAGCLVGNILHYKIRGQRPEPGRIVFVSTFTATILTIFFIATQTGD